MVPMMLILDLISQSGKSLGTHVSEMRELHPSSGELNFDARASCGTNEIIEMVAARYSHQAIQVSRLDGLSMAFGTWRFNLRASNTEPLLRLNVEAISSTSILDQHMADLTTLIAAHGAVAA